MARINGISSTALLLEEWLSEQPDGMLLFPTDVPILAPVKTITNLLASAVKKGLLSRLASGIYQKPKIDPVLGPLQSSTDDIASAIARRDGARIIPTGALALNRLGLSTQIPMRPVYLTDGAPRNIKIGKRELRFQKITLKLLSIKGELSLLAVLALKELKQEGIEENTASVIIKALLHEKEETLRHDVRLVTAWMRPFFHEAISIKTQNKTIHD